MTTQASDEAAGASRTLVVVVGLRQEARIARVPGLNVIVGGGCGERLAAELEGVLAATRYAAVLSFGVAGALSPELGVGDGLAPDDIVTPAGVRLATDTHWTARLRARTGAGAGAIVGVDAVVGAPAAKAQLWAETGAAAIDMESHLAASAAARHGAPFAALRVISDRADQTLPAAAAVGMRSDGGVDVFAILHRLVFAPREFPALIRTGRDAGRAFHALERVRRSSGTDFAV